MATPSPRSSSHPPAETDHARSNAKPLPCDQCHKRKVKCGGGLPCNRCLDSAIPCSRDIVRKKRGPKKGHGAVISRLRAESSNSTPEAHPHYDSATSSPIAEHHSTGIAVSSLLNEPPPISNFPPLSSDSYITLNEFAQQILTQNNLFGPQQHYFSSPIAPSFGSPVASNTGSSSVETFPKLEPFDSHPPDMGTPPLVESNLGSPAFWSTLSVADMPLINRCVDLFFTNLYPVYPVIDEAAFRAKLQSPASLPDIDRVLVLAMCAITVVHVSGWPSLSQENRAVLCKRLIQQALTLRLTCDFTELSSLSGVLTSLFLQTSYFELRRRRSSWFYLREAITLAQAARLHEAAGYEGMNYIEQICARRLYCLLFITERGASILSVLPVSIKYVPQLPGDPLPNENPAILSGLRNLHMLFGLLDENFVELWNAPTDQTSTTVDPLIVATVQQNLRNFNLDQLELTIIQSADLKITQQWLRLVYWQAAMRQGMITSTAADSAFTYDFPREIAGAMAKVLKTLPQAAIQVHGLGIFEKQFEVAYSLLDNLALSQSQSPEDYENLRYIFNVLSASPASKDTYVRALETKMDSQRRPSTTAGIEFVVNWDLRTQEGRRLSVI